MEENLIVSKFHFFRHSTEQRRKRREFLISAFQGIFIFIFQLQYLRKKKLKGFCGGEEEEKRLIRFFKLF